MKTLNVYLSCVLAVGAVTWSAVAPVGAEQSAPRIQQQVERSLRGGDFGRIEVSVADSEVTLTGTVPHLLAKNEAIERALDIEGVETVASELQFSFEEDDPDVADEVGKAINRYPHFTIWDYIDGRINNGVVTLSGSVTPSRNKKRELYERIAKIRGVQDYVDEIDVQSVARSDERLRGVIGRSLANSPHFERTVRMRNPPYHIVVNRSSVTIYGYVQSEIEYREMERIIRQTLGILNVDNQLQALR